jgi:hypothetical protein
VPSDRILMFRVNSPLFVSKGCPRFPHYNTGIYFVGLAELNASTHFISSKSIEDLYKYYCSNISSNKKPTICFGNFFRINHFLLPRIFSSVGTYIWALYVCMYVWCHRLQWPLVYTMYVCRSYQVLYTKSKATHFVLRKLRPQITLSSSSWNRLQ